MKQKLKLKSIKGYLQIDIAFAILIFFLLFFTIYSFDSENKNSRRNVISSNDLNMLSHDICTLLISTSGQPTNWENNINNADIFGLKEQNSTNLDSNKINQFSSDNYFTIRNTFSENVYIYVQVLGINSNTSYLNFGTNAYQTNIKSSKYNCYSNYNSEPVEITVEAWQ